MRSQRLCFAFHFCFCSLARTLTLEPLVFCFFEKRAYFDAFFAKRYAKTLFFSGFSTVFSYPSNKLPIFLYTFLVFNNIIPPLPYISTHILPSIQLETAYTYTQKEHYRHNICNFVDFCDIFTPKQNKNIGIPIKSRCFTLKNQSKRLIFYFRIHPRVTHRCLFHLFHHNKAAILALILTYIQLFVINFNISAP